jgi:hypothetical protein
MSKTKTGALLLSALLTSSLSFGQYAGDALRYSEMNQTGSARFQALGGNHAAIGGDPSSIFGNPAGLGFYNRSEISISPAVTVAGTKTNYLANPSSTSRRHRWSLPVSRVFSGNGNAPHLVFRFQGNSLFRTAINTAEEITTVLIWIMCWKGLMVIKQPWKP